MDSRVDIVIPTFNRADRVMSAIRSALEQDYANIHVIVVDDGSSDGTCEAVATLLNPQLTYYRQPTNIGMISNWEHGFRMAGGEYVVLLGDDDALDRCFVSRRMEWLTNDKSLVVAFGGYRRTDDSGIVMATLQSADKVTRVLRGADLLRAAVGHDWFIGSSVYRRDYLLAAWEYVRNDGLALDYSLNLHLALVGGIAGAWLPGADLRYGWHPGSASNSRRAQVAEDACCVLRRLADGAQSSANASVLEKGLQNWYVTTGRIAGSEGRVKDARKSFRAAIRRNPSFLSAWKQLLMATLCERAFVRSARSQFD